MAALANTFQTTNAVGNREELSDVVSRITPEDTPIYSLIEKGKCVSVHPEWETDELAAPAANIKPEGDEYTFGAITPPERMGNYTQIMRKEWIISRTQETVSNGGNAEKRKYQKLKKGVEIRKDVEFAIVDTNASVAGSTREFGSLNTWIETNVSRGAGGANGGFDSGTGLTVAPTNGTQRAFTKAILDSVMQSGYQSGANFRHVSVSPYVKSVFVTFMSDANVAPFRYAVSKGGERNTIVATADYYEGPFGTVMIHPNRVQAVGAAQARNAFFLDTDMVEFLWLDKIQEDKKVAKTGDADKGVIIGEGTLKVKNEKGLGVAADLFGLTAAS
ncbi:head protein [Sinorhizobium medicae]|nr:head protein [Sinorhizobium medicae]